MADRREQKTAQWRWFAGLCLALSLISTTFARTPNREDFSETELEWLEKNPIVYYSDDVSWEPFVRVNDQQQLEGISVDYINLIAQKTGLTFQFVRSENWSQVIDKLKRKQIHLVLAAIPTEERYQFADFSQAYFASPLAIVTGPEYSYIQDVEELYGKKIALPRDYYSVEFLQKEHPLLNLVFYENLDKCLTAVAQGEVDAFIGNLAVSVFKLKLTPHTQLKISGTIERTLAVRMMIAKGNAPLVNIINRSLDRISESEKRTIVNSWFNVAVESGINPKVLWTSIGLSASALLLILIWVFHLRKEIAWRKKMESNLVMAKQEAEKANKAKASFLANMSHEIRTPMNAVFGFSQLLSETELNPQQREYVEAIQVGSNGLLHIINDILEISKIEAGKMSIEMGLVDISRILAEIKQLFAEPMKQKQLAFTTYIAEEVPSLIISDGNRIRQILINLVGNALKFTENGFVEISVTKNPLHLDQIKFSVMDSGIGIANHRFQSIFEHFEYQITPGENHIASTGLGLSICKKLAEKLNARIEVESELGKGSCFHLVLDKIKEPDRTIHSSPLNQSAFAASRILIVDDVKSNRLILEKYLSGYPFQIEQAENGLEAVEKAKANRPDIILMDVRMPVMDGYEATKVIKQLDRSISIIAVTASALEDDESGNRNKVFDAFLRKPILKKKILSVLEQFAVRK